MNKEILNYKSKGLCKKHQVLALAKIGDKTYIGENWVRNPQDVCPRANIKTGEGYELCKSVCDQTNHAEVDLVEIAPDLKGSDVYIFGHYYACDNCLKILKKANVGKVICEKEIIGEAILQSQLTLEDI